jgi:hypothetical protein
VLSIGRSNSSQHTVRLAGCPDLYARSGPGSSKGAEALVLTKGVPRLYRRALADHLDVHYAFRQRGDLVAEGSQR